MIVIDDYAHHPTEIRATLSAARAAYPGHRLVAVFQPHLYSRTRDFANEFATALSAADLVWVTDVYPAREAPIPGVTGELITRAIAHGAPARISYEPELEQLAGRVRGQLKQGDVVVFMGAGSIDGAARSLLGRLAVEPRP